MATRIDGKALAAKVKAQVAEKAAKLPRQPGLAVVLIGDAHISPESLQNAAISAEFRHGSNPLP